MPLWPGWRNRDALAAGSADALGIVATGLTTIAVLAVAVSAHASGELDRTLVAALALLSLASFEAVALRRRRPASSRRCSIRTARSRAHRPRAGGAGPARPTGDSIGHAGDRPGRRQRPLLGRGATGAPARRSDPRARAEAGPGGPERGGKDDHRPPALAVSRPVRRSCHACRRGLAPRFARRTSGARSPSPDRTRTSSRRASGRTFASDARRRPTPRWMQRSEQAKVGDWVSSLPDGAGTLVGEEGTQLSGGQRQRIALARALLSEAPVLVLDEPTAHLDSETAEALVRDMLEAAEGRSVLLITHRPGRRPPRRRGRRDGLGLGRHVAGRGHSRRRCADAHARPSDVRALTPPCTRRFRPG